MKITLGGDEKHHFSDEGLCVRDECHRKGVPGDKPYIRRTVTRWSDRKDIQIIEWDDFSEFAEYVGDDLKWTYFDDNLCDFKDPMFDPVRDKLPSKNDRTDINFHDTHWMYWVSDGYCQE